MDEQNLTQERLKELVHYDPLTGVFTRRVALCSSVKVGDVMGRPNEYGYLRAGVAGLMYALHRLAFLYMTGVFQLEQIDHINHRRADNRWANLRPVSCTENLQNQSMYKNNTSGYAGVFWRSDNSKWRVEIWVYGKRKYLGCFLNISDAIAARQAANIKYNFHPNHGK